MNSQIILAQHSQQILEIIKKRIGKCTVYVWHSRIINDSSNGVLVNTECVSVRHYCILVLTQDNTKYNAVSIANFILEVVNKDFSISVIMHKTKELATKRSSQQLFFDNVFRNGQRLCFDKSAPPYLLVNFIEPRNLEKDKMYWLKCSSVAQFNIHAASESSLLNIELCKISLLNTACIQLALGLIRLYLGYTPNEFNLNHLLRLCGSFTEIPNQLFHQQNSDAIRHYKMLCTPSSMLNHWTRLDANEQDFLCLLDTCKQFFSQTNKKIADILSHQIHLNTQI